MQMMMATKQMLITVMHEDDSPAFSVRMADSTSGGKPTTQTSQQVQSRWAMNSPEHCSKSIIQAK